MRERERQRKTTQKKRRNRERKKRERNRKENARMTAPLSASGFFDMGQPQAPCLPSGGTLAPGAAAQQANAASVIKRSRRANQRRRAAAMAAATAARDAHAHVGGDGREVQTTVPNVTGLLGGARRPQQQRDVTNGVNDVDDADDDDEISDGGQPDQFDPDNIVLVRLTQPNDAATDADSSRLIDCGAMTVSMHADELLRAAAVGASVSDSFVAVCAPVDGAKDPQETALASSVKGGTQTEDITNASGSTEVEVEASMSVAPVLPESLGGAAPYSANADALQNEPGASAVHGWWPMSAVAAMIGVRSSAPVASPQPMPAPKQGTISVAPVPTVGSGLPHDTLPLDPVVRIPEPAEPVTTPSDPSTTSTSTPAPVAPAEAVISTTDLQPPSAPTFGHCVAHAAVDPHQVWLHALVDTIEPHLARLRDAAVGRRNAPANIVVFASQTEVPLACSLYLGRSVGMHVTVADGPMRNAVSTRLRCHVKTWARERPNRWGANSGVPYVMTTIAPATVDMVLDFDATQTSETHVALFEALAPRLAPNATYITHHLDASMMAAMSAVVQAGNAARLTVLRSVLVLER